MFNFVKNLITETKLGTYDNVPCNESDFYYYHDYNYGSCYSFNNGKSNNANGSEKETVTDIKKAVFIYYNKSYLT